MKHNEAKTKQRNPMLRNKAKIFNQIIEYQYYILIRKMKFAKSGEIDMYKILKRDSETQENEIKIV